MLSARGEEYWISYFGFELGVDDYVKYLAQRAHGLCVNAAITQTRRC